MTSKFYEIIPDPTFRNSVPQPLDRHTLQNKRRLLSDLKDYDKASNIIMAALNDPSKTNPLDYCYNAF